MQTKLSGTSDPQGQYDGLTLIAEVDYYQGGKTQVAKVNKPHLAPEHNYGLGYGLTECQ